MAFLLLDYPACERFAWLGSVTVDGEPRNYYALEPNDNKLAILVTRGAKLAERAGLVMDASIGWDNGLPGYAFYPGRQHTKITVYDRVIDADGESTLSDILSKAPERRKE